MDENYQEVYEFLVFHRYQTSFSKNLKRILRRRRQEQFFVKWGQLLYSRIANSRAVVDNNICMGVDPYMLKYMQTQMRAQLLRGLESGCLSPSTSCGEHTNKEKNISCSQLRYLHFVCVDGHGAKMIEHTLLVGH